MRDALAYGSSILPFQLGGELVKVLLAVLELEPELGVNRVEDVLESLGEAFANSPSRTLCGVIGIIESAP